MSTSKAGGTAEDATVWATLAKHRPAKPEGVREQEYRERYADDCERAVEVITEKLEGIKATLAAAKVEAKQARADAQKGKGA